MTPGAVLMVLTAEEELLSDVQVTSFAQGSAVGGRPRPNVGMDWSPVVGGLTVDDNWLSGTLTGYSAGGPSGAVADHFARALSDLGIAQMLLTSTRLALYKESGRKPGQPVLAFSAHRGWLTDVRLAPRPLQHGRLRLQFADGSWAMAAAGILLPTAALRFVRRYRESR